MTSTVREPHCIARSDHICLCWISAILPCIHDRYGEFYGEMHDFHQLLPKLLKPGGIYSFFSE